MYNTISAIIPTLNRPDDLCKAVKSTVNQSRAPDELIIVDQSRDESSRNIVQPLFNNLTGIKLRYILNPGISSLVEAKSVGVSNSSGDIISFLEDDIILEKDYFKNVEHGFEEYQDMMGCSGVITNQPYQGKVYITFHEIFFKGIFKDDRTTLFSSYKKNRNLVKCDTLSGGLSSWKKDVFKEVPFDVKNGFFMFEDIEFSTRVVKKYGHHLYVNPNARLEHHYSPVNRDPHGYRQRRKLTEAVLFFKKRRDWAGAYYGLFLALTWWLAEASYQSLKLLSFGPVLGYFKGIKDGISKELIN